MQPGCLIVLLLYMTVYCQSEKKYEVSTIVFYNVENLFDTIDDPSTRDEARTPAGRYRWTGQRYRLKVERIAEIIQKTGGLNFPAPADIVGLCEVENLGVLEDLVRHPLLSP